MNIRGWDTFCHCINHLGLLQVLAAGRSLPHDSAVWAPIASLPLPLTPSSTVYFLNTAFIWCIFTAQSPVIKYFGALNTSCAQLYLALKAKAGFKLDRVFRLWFQVPGPKQLLPRTTLLAVLTQHFLELVKPNWGNLCRFKIGILGAGLFLNTAKFECPVAPNQSCH